MVDFAKYINDNPYTVERKHMSMFDFSDSDKQHERGPIPPDSMVLLEMNLRQPKPELTGSDPWLRMSNDGMCEMLDCEFVVASGSFTGKRIWKLFVMDGGTEKHKQIKDRNREVIRAILDSARNIDPDDHSDAAKAARRVSSFEDFIGIRFAAVIGVDRPKPGDQYINNNIKRVITMADEEYATIMEGGEVITDKPIPEIPQAEPEPTKQTSWGKPQTKEVAKQGNLMSGATASKQPAQKTTWGKPAAQATTTAKPQEQTEEQPANEAEAGEQEKVKVPPKVNRGQPQWTKSKAAKGKSKAKANDAETPADTDDVGPAFPSEATGMDDVPF